MMHSSYTANDTATEVSADAACDTCAIIIDAAIGADIYAAA